MRRIVLASQGLIDKISKTPLPPLDLVPVNLRLTIQ